MKHGVTKLHSEHSVGEIHIVSQFFIGIFLRSHSCSFSSSRTQPAASFCKCRFWSNHQMLSNLWSFATCQIHVHAMRGPRGKVSQKLQIEALPDCKNQMYCDPRWHFDCLQPLRSNLKLIFEFFCDYSKQCVHTIGLRQYSIVKAVKVG